MKKLSTGTRNALIVLAVYIATGIVCIYILRLPWYMSLPVLTAVTAALYFVFYKELLAVRGNLAYMKGDHEKAKRLLKLSIDKDVPSPVAHYNYANLVLRDGDAETALSCLRKSRALKPAPIMEKNIYMTIGSAYWVAGEVDKAIETLEQMQKDYEYVNENVLSTLAYMYFAKGDFATAHELTDKALAEAPEYAAAWDNRGQIFLAQEDLTQAKEAFAKALAYKPTLVDSLYYMGVLYEREGDADAAQSYFARAAEAPISALNTVTTAQIAAKLTTPPSGHPS